ncbi:MAG: YidC/Oxa1 family membrane protein insertase [bacterium]
MAQLFTTLFYQPLFNLLIFFYNLTWHDLGLAIIVLTILVKMVLWPLSRQSTLAQKKLQVLQPRLEEIKKKYKDNREQQAKTMMELYRQEKINPLSSCLPVLIQLPVFIAVFQVFSSGLKSANFNLLYPFIANPGSLNSTLLGLFDLTKPNVVLAILAGLSQYWQTKMLMGKKDNAPQSSKPGEGNLAAIMNKQMLYFMPVLVIFFGLSLPSGLTLYWLIFNLLTILQQFYLFKEKPS